MEWTVKNTLELWDQEPNTSLVFEIESADVLLVCVCIGVYTLDY